MMHGCMSWESSGYRTFKCEHYLANVMEQMSSAAGVDTPFYTEQGLRGGFCD